MSTYLAFFKIRFIHNLQYRAAAYAGIATQFAFGFIHIMVYDAFYVSNEAAAPMEFSQVVSYLWLQQAFLALFMTWLLDNELFQLITQGSVVYELCRPLHLYNVWFMKSCAHRLSMAVLRCLPILIIASFLPEPYHFSFPSSFSIFCLFIISMFFAFIVVVAYCMFVYIFTFYTISPMGVRIILVMTADFFSGALVPLPFFPDWFVKVVQFTPFGSMQNVPFQIYNGSISMSDSFGAIGMQMIWAVVLIITGKWFFTHTLKRIVIQGG